MKIFGYLLDRDACLQKNYINLAMTCKKFFHLAETKFIQIKNLQPETEELVALHSYVVDIDSEFQKKYAQDSSGDCAAHSGNPSYRCFHRALSKVLSFKHSIIRGIRIVDYDLETENCLDSINSTKLDGIVELVIIECKIRTRTLHSLLQKLKNVVSLHLLGNYNDIHVDTESERIPYPAVERNLKYLYISESSDTRSKSRKFDWLHPKLILKAKIVAIENLYGCSELSNGVLNYLRRFRDDIELVRIRIFESSAWFDLALREGFDTMKCEIAIDWGNEAKRLSFGANSSEPGLYLNLGDIYKSIRLLYPERFQVYNAWKGIEVDPDGASLVLLNDDDASSIEAYSSRQASQIIYEYLLYS